MYHSELNFVLHTAAEARAIREQRSKDIYTNLCIRLDAELCDPENSKELDDDDGLMLPLSEAEMRYNQFLKSFFEGRGYKISFSTFYIHIQEK